VLWTLLGAVGLVFLIACANLATLSLARASARQRELAVRKALGATSFRVVRQLLTESFMLAIAGGVVGALLAFWGMRFLLALSPTQLPRQQEIGVSVGVFMFAAGSAVIATVIVGVFPAWQAARSEVTGELKIAGRGAGDGARRNRSRRLLVVTEVALSFMLLISAGLLIRSLMRVQAIEPGFDATDVLSVRVSLPRTKYRDHAAVAQFCDRLLEKVRDVPGVEATGAVSVLPFSGDRHSVDFTIDGRASYAADRHNSQYRIVTPDYFSTMRIPLLRGRALDAHDDANSVPVALINESMASKFWPDGGAVGARINIDDNNENKTKSAASSSLSYRRWKNWISLVRCRCFLRPTVLPAKTFTHSRSPPAKTISKLKARAACSPFSRNTASPKSTAQSTLSCSFAASLLDP